MVTQAQYLNPDLNMNRIAFKMKLFPGMEKEYKERHDAIWDDLRDLLKETGIHNFSIFLDTETNTLFAYLEAEDVARLESLPGHPVQQKWWTYMRDIMDTNEDHSPVQIKLQEVFHLP
jgi:L-rhamnose mutarotase